MEEWATTMRVRDTYDTYIDCSEYRQVQQLQVIWLNDEAHVAAVAQESIGLPLELSKELSRRVTITDGRLLAAAGVGLRVVG